MIAGVLFTLPDATSTLTAIGAYSSPLFDDFFPLALLIAGILLPILAVTLIIRIFHHR